MMGSVPRSASPRPAPPREVVLVANANASGAAGAAGAERVARTLSRLGARVELHRTHAPEEVAQVWTPDDGRRVVLLGGDGTLHSAANLPGRPPEVALIPAGGANNVAHALGIPSDPEAAARLALEGRPAAIDLIQAWAGDRRAIAVEGLSVGFLALARSRYHASNSTDVVAALHAGLAALTHFHPLDVRLVSGREPDVLHIGQLFVANIGCFGTGLRVAPGADPRDGLLDVVAVDIPGRHAIPRMLLRLRRGTHPGHRGVLRWRTDRLRIETRGRSPVMADTDNLGCGPVDVVVLPAALPIVVPGADGSP